MLALERDALNKHNLLNVYDLFALAANLENDTPTFN